jgi:hypothetical protein
MTMMITIPRREITLCGALETAKQTLLLIPCRELTALAAEYVRHNLMHCTDNRLYMKGVPDESMKWHIENAAGGDFVILTATEDTAYYMDLFNDAANQLGMPLNSVRQIYFLDREASADESVLEAITNAEAIFFGG